MHIGQVVFLDREGVVVVRDQQSHRHFAFTFDKIKGYRGETAREIGLREGRQVRFDMRNDQVASVELMAR